MEDVQQRQMVSIQVRKAASGLVRLLVGTWWSEEDRLHTEHGSYGQGFVAATVHRSFKQHLGNERIHWERANHVSYLGQRATLVEAAYQAEGLQCPHQRLWRRWVRKVEVCQVLDSQALQC